jgi:hypothetical protein
MLELTAVEKKESLVVTDLSASNVSVFLQL